MKKPTGSSEGEVSPNVAKIVDEVAKLTLLETSALVKELKARLNIQDVAMPVMAAAPGAAGGAAAEAPKEEEKIEQTEFKVKLEKVDAASKAKVIREIKALMPGMNLVEAKKFVEGVPKVVKEKVSKDEAEKLKKQLEAIGGTVVLE